MNSSSHVLQILRRAVFTRRGMFFLATAVLLLGAVVIGGEALGTQLSSIESRISSLGPMGKLALIPAYVILTSLLFPDTLLRISAGALFGPVWGVLGVALATLLGTLLQFTLARPFAAPIERFIIKRPKMRAIQHVVLNEGLRLQLLIRLTPVNHASITYMLGAAGIRLVPLLLALPAMLPSIVLEVWIGHIGNKVVHMGGSETGSYSMSEVISYVGLGIGAVAVIFAAREAHRAISRAIDQDTN
ncbi:VTT domain-containing protein [Granulosicoccus antarcticus]|uniref:TVP38/TMEM64 family membrane protein n=1 Tax=Granulosicoccus antarcticus IMCC3135 TaxID=1192854 RepID=A0A2Z2NQQ1_9GAMM|nr:VTT domain-containing protein [Granulosicoccus antarcticus]ASJ73549.1 hypothetical protein IMCC3135_17335 [Granulosicoccus antarcticus IMCC3135]